MNCESANRRIGKSANWRIREIQLPTPNFQPPISNLQSQRGFTLMELLVATAIIAIVTGMLVMIMYQIMNIPHWGNAQLTVDNNLRNAGLWLMRDGNESESFTQSGTCGIFTTGHGTLYTYALSGNALQRADSSTGWTIEVARHVSGLTCIASGDSVAVTLDVMQGSVSASATYTVTMRVNP